MEDRSHSPHSSALGLLCRLFWIFIGNGILFVLALKIIMPGTRSSMLVDVLFGVTIAALVLSRYVDIRFCAGETAEGGEPATLIHWKRYAVKLVGFSLGLWIVAHTGALLIQRACVSRS